MAALNLTTGGLNLCKEPIVPDDSKKAEAKTTAKSTVKSTKKK